MELPSVTDSTSIDPRSTSELVTQAVREMRELVDLEIKLAKEEVRGELVQAKRAAVAGALALALGLWAVAVLLVALILALGGTALNALIVGAVLLLACAGGAAYAYTAVPRDLLHQSRNRLKDDINRLKEHAA
jgi:uncharacterized membrane protein YqjE